MHVYFSYQPSASLVPSINHLTQLLRLLHCHPRLRLKLRYRQLRLRLLHCHPRLRLKLRYRQLRLRLLHCHHDDDYYDDDRSNSSLHVQSRTADLISSLQL
jgi:hypothetical protein